MEILARRLNNGTHSNKTVLQYTVQLCCTVYQRSLYIVAVVRMCKGLDCVCPQINAARVENCWLQDSFQTVPQQSSQTSNTYSDKKPLHALHSFVHQNKRPYKSQRCLGICLKTGSQTLAPGAHQLCFICDVVKNVRHVILLLLQHLQQVLSAEPWYKRSRGIIRSW